MCRSFALPVASQSLTRIVTDWPIDAVADTVACSGQPRKSVVLGYYDPETGRFLRRDLIGYADGPSL